MDRRGVPEHPDLAGVAAVTGSIAWAARTGNLPSPPISASFTPVRALGMLPGETSPPSGKVRRARTQMHADPATGRRLPVGIDLGVLLTTSTNRRRFGNPNRPSATRPHAAASSRLSSSTDS